MLSTRIRIRARVAAGLGFVHIVRSFESPPALDNNGPGLQHKLIVWSNHPTLILRDCSGK
jgi:hypothetical protein